MFLRVRASRERAQMVFHQAGKAGPAFAGHPFAYPNRSRIQQEILASLHVRNRRVMRICQVFPVSV